MIILLTSCSKDLESCESSLTLSNIDMSKSEDSCIYSSSVSLNGPIIGNTWYDGREIEFGFGFGGGNAPGGATPNLIGDNGQSIGLELSFRESTKELLLVDLFISEALAEEVNIHHWGGIWYEFSDLYKTRDFSHFDLDIIELETHFEATIYLEYDDFILDATLFSIHPIF